MGHRFEFDPVNKILLMRVEGRLRDESALRWSSFSKVRFRSTGNG